MLTRCQVNNVEKELIQFGSGVNFDEQNFLQLPTVELKKKISKKDGKGCISGVNPQISLSTRDISSGQLKITVELWCLLKRHTVTYENA